MKSHKILLSYHETFPAHGFSWTGVAW